MKFLIRVYDRCMGWTHPLQSLILLIIRIIWGWQFVWIGWQKLQNIHATTDYFSSLGMSQPQNMAQIVGGIEFGCGLLIFLGLLTRLAALPLVVVMIGTFFTAHSQAALSIFSDFETFTKQPSFLFLYASLLLLAFGPGKISIDYLVRSKTSS